MYLCKCSFKYFFNHCFRQSYYFFFSHLQQLIEILRCHLYASAEEVVPHVLYSLKICYCFLIHLVLIRLTLKVCESLLALTQFIESVFKKGHERLVSQTRDYLLLNANKLKGKDLEEVCQPKNFLNVA